VCVIIIIINGCLYIKQLLLIVSSGVVLFLILDFMHSPAVSSPWKQKLAIRFISNSKFLFLWGGYSCGVHEVIIVLFTATVQQNFSK